MDGRGDANMDLERGVFKSDKPSEIAQSLKRSAEQQAVIGEAPAPAALMLVGEQPGDQEDRAGRARGPPPGSRLEGKRS